MDSILFYTELTGLPVLDTRGRRIGRVRDAAVVPLVHPARIDRFLVGAGAAWLSVRFDQVASISLGGIQLSDEQLTPYHSDEYMLRIGRDLLDQQIIDVDGRKVVRVNDVELESTQKNSHVELNVVSKASLADALALALQRIGRTVVKVPQRDAVALTAKPTAV